jgi:hypothetical protein
VHATGSRAERRQRRQEAKGRKESRDRRVDCDPQDERRRERSWEVKKASEVLRFECDILSRKLGVVGDQGAAKQSIAITQQRMMKNINKDFTTVGFDLYSRREIDLKRFIQPSVIGQRTAGFGENATD